MSIYPLVITQLRNLDGSLRLDLSPGTGWRRRLVSGGGGVSWRENHTESTYLDGATEVTPPVRAIIKRAEQLKVAGLPELAGDEEAYWLDVEDRIDELEAACSTRFLWVISTGGYVWAYRTLGPASLDATQTPKEDLAAGRRQVLLSFSCQPNPTKIPREELV